MNKIRTFLFYLLIPSLFLSYYPIISLGSSNAMNYELSLPLILLVLFTIVSFPSIYQRALVIAKSKTRYLFVATLLFPLYSSLSIIWSPNSSRAILTSGIIWCLYFSVASIVDLLSRKTPSIQEKKNLCHKIFLASSVVICIICWLQCLLDVLGVDRSVTLLCLGCTYKSFGFPHPSGFAIEPQFMGNLLLAPTIYILYICNKTEQNVKKQNKLLLLLFSTTLFLTFSRGAIYAFSIGVIVMLSILFVKKISTKKSIISSLGIIIASFLLCLLSQGFLSAISPTNDTFSSGIAKSINQLSLGLIEIRPRFGPIEKDINNSEEDISNPENISVFDGYVEESTDVRLSLNASALSTSLDSPANFLFGYGLGSAGTVLANKSLTAHPKEIVQNEYLSLLLELGIIGLLFFVYIIVVLFITIKKSLNDYSLERLSIDSLLLAFLFTLLFFSGLPNALHLYLFPIFILFLFPKHKPIID